MAKKEVKPSIDTEELTQQLLSLRHRGFLVLSIGAVGAMLACVFMGIIPTIDAITTGYTTLETETANTATLQSKKTQVDNISNDIDYANFAETGRVDQILYTDNPFVPMMYAMDEARTENNIAPFTRQEFSPGLVATPSAEFASLRRSQQSNASRASRQKDSEGFTIFLEVRAPYASLVQFLNDLESYAPFNSIAYSEISNNLGGMATGQFEIIAQYYPPTMQAKLENAIPALNDDDKITLEMIDGMTIPNLSDLTQSDFINYNRDNPFRSVAPIVLDGGEEEVVPVQQ